MSLESFVCCSSRIHRRHLPGYLFRLFNRAFPFSPSSRSIRPGRLFIQCPLTLLSFRMGSRSLAVEVQMFVLFGNGIYRADSVLSCSFPSHLPLELCGHFHFLFLVSYYSAFFGPVFLSTCLGKVPLYIAPRTFFMFYFSPPLSLLFSFCVSCRPFEFSPFSLWDKSMFLPFGVRILTSFSLLSSRVYRQLPPRF